MRSSPNIINTFMLISELFEANEPDVLYHGTSFQHLVEIIQTNTLGRPTEGFVSLTREKAAARSFARSRSANSLLGTYTGNEEKYLSKGELETIAYFRQNSPIAYMEWMMIGEGDRGIVMAINKRKLANNHKIAPYDDRGTIRSGRMGV